VEEMTKIATHASSLRDGTPSGYFVNYTAGANGIVGRLCFEDDMCWATKISLQRDNYYTIGMRHAVRSLVAIAAYCPTLPAPRVHGYSIDNENATFCYYFMDWMEGRTLNLSVTWTKVAEERDIEGGFEVNITVPEKAAPQLASFFYDLTTCPIPKEKSIIPKNHKNRSSVIISVRTYLRPFARHSRITAKTQSQWKSYNCRMGQEGFGHGHPSVARKQAVKL
jgi:hypothetical protein